MFIEDKRKRFIISRWAYLMGEPIISDIEYDELEKWFRKEYPTDPRSIQPWSFDDCPIELLKEFNLNEWIVETVMGYQAESIPSLNTEQSVHEMFGSLNERSRVSFKIDGWNTRASYYNGNLVRFETRGRSGSNLDITSMSKIVPMKIPVKGRVAVTGETNIPNKLWDLYKQRTGNSDQRASVRTAIANGDVDYLAFLAFNVFIENEHTLPDNDIYKLLTEWGFKTPMFRWVDSYQSLMKCIQFMSVANNGYKYLTDGLVVENSKVQYAIRIGAWKEELMCSYVTGYKEKQGMYGVYMNIEFKPVKIGGKRYSECPITNIATIQENKLKIGSPIAFNQRSAANVVFDSTGTYKLQKEWAGRYDEYKEHIDNRKDG